MDENSVMLRLKRVRSKVSDAPSTISIPHPQPSESAFKHSQYSQKNTFFAIIREFKKSWPLQSSGKGTQQRFQMSAAIPNGYSLIFWIRRIFWNVIFFVNLILWLYSICFCKSIRCGYERSGLRQSSNFSYIKLQLDIFNLGWKEQFHIVIFLGWERNII